MISPLQNCVCVSLYSLLSVLYKRGQYAHLWTVFSQRHSWSCTWLQTWNGTEVVGYIPIPSSDCSLIIAWTWDRFMKDVPIPLFLLWGVKIEECGGIATESCTRIRKTSLRGSVLPFIGNLLVIGYCSWSTHHITTVLHQIGQTNRQITLVLLVLLTTFRYCFLTLCEKTVGLCLL